MRASTLGAALAAVTATVVVGACGSSTAGSDDQPTGVPAASATQPAASCQARQVNPADPQSWEPDPRCTPGATDGGLQLAQVCPTAHTKQIRPPVSYTDPLKADQMRAYGDTGTASSYEEDHLIPLSAGGSPKNPLNLWPEPGASIDEKDKVEDALHSAVCSGKIPLTEAQHRIATDWYALGRELGVVH